VFDRYRGLLSRPGAAAFAFAGLLSRLPGSMFNISFLMMVQAQYDSYAIAGRVTAIGTLVWAVQTVPTGRLVDRIGQRRGMPPLVALHVLGVVIGIATAMTRGPEAWLWVAAALASLSGPLGSLTRARWSHILSSDADIHSAFALEGILDETLFIVGPAIAAVLVAHVYPAAGLIVATIGLLVGISILLSQHSTEPPPRLDEAPAIGFKVPRPVVAVSLLGMSLGLIFGGIDIGVVKFAESAGHKGLTGAVLSALSLGSFLGGLAYGARRWRVSLERRILIGSLLAGVGFGLLSFAPNLAAFSVVGFFAGSTIAPLIASSDNLIQRTVRKDQLTEGLAWLRIGIGVGVAAGGATAGAMIESLGPRGGFFVSGVSALAVALTAIAVFPWLGHSPGGRTIEPDALVEHPPAQPAV
jgi:MFS family permease